MTDMILIRIPAMYDFRKRPLFPGPIAYTLPETTDQFIIPPIGILSTADLLDRNGYKVVADNLADRMVHDKLSDAELHIKRSEAKTYAVGLQRALLELWR